MPSKKEHEADSPLTQNQNNAMSEDPRDGDRLTDKPGASSKKPVGKAPAHDRQNQATIEEFSQEGMGVAPKE